MENGWEASAEAWVEEMGDRGDFGRRYVLDPVMLPLALARRPKKALDVGCGEGRFCRMLNRHGVEATGVDPTSALIGVARGRDREGEYVAAAAERLPFGPECFDLVLSYLSLIDIPDIDLAIPEMTRVLKPGGALLIANLNSFNTAGLESGWAKDESGQRLHFPIDDYLRERPLWVAYRGIRIRNYHRPLGLYMRTLLGTGLRLEYFDEPRPSGEARASSAANYCRAPWFLIMEWVKPGAGDC